MKRTIKKSLLALCLAIIMVFCIENVCVDVYAASIGQSLPQPEAGWKRIDDSNEFLYYQGKWYHGTIDSIYAYNGTWSIPDGPNKKVTVKFKGTKFRIIAGVEKNNYQGCKNIEVKIDGENAGKASCYGDLKRKVLVYSKEELDNCIHTVNISNVEPGEVWFDAIDIDSDGELLDAHPVKVSGITLDKNDIKMDVNTTENLVASVLPEDAENKDVTWTSSNEKICTVDESGKVTAVSGGSATITATAKDGSGQSASCTVTVVDNRHGVLTINMNNGRQYIYDMSFDEINNFINWYNDRSEGKGSPTYVIKTKPSSGAYKTHTDYLKYDYISDFSVDEY